MVDETFASSSERPVEPGQIWALDDSHVLLVLCEICSSKFVVVNLLNGRTTWLYDNFVEYSFERIA